MTDVALLTAARREFHRAVGLNLLRVDADGIPANADKHNPTSIAIARSVAEAIHATASGSRMTGQGSGSTFEDLVVDFLRATFLSLGHLRPGAWEIMKLNARDRLGIARYQQYAHLALLSQLAAANKQLAAALGKDYLIVPDAVIVRHPESDAGINVLASIVDQTVATLSDLRARAGGSPILHASISSKWTLRSDRAQNARTEALNLLRNRKGHLPHIVVVTGEPLPSRLASLALGTGDIDCAYHFALPELMAAVNSGPFDSSTTDLMTAMVDGKRLKDISDLPLDLAT